MDSTAHFVAALQMICHNAVAEQCGHIQSVSYMPYSRVSRTRVQNSAAIFADYCLSRHHSVLALTCERGRG
jgi:hypothetical protein